MTSTLDATQYPDAVCNDGSTASMYVSQAAAQTNDWVVHLQGGSACRNYDECLDRWCSQFDQFAFPHERQPRMMGDPLPPRVAMGGIMDASTGNEFSSWNRVFVPYCSSDAWFGDATVTWDDPNSRSRWTSSSTGARPSSRR